MKKKYLAYVLSAAMLTSMMPTTSVHAQATGNSAEGVTVATKAGEISAVNITGLDKPVIDGAPTVKDTVKVTGSIGISVTTDAVTWYEVPTTKLDTLTAGNVGTQDHGQAFSEAKFRANTANNQYVAKVVLTAPNANKFDTSLQAANVTGTGGTVLNNADAVKVENAAPGDGSTANKLTFLVSFDAVTAAKKETTATFAAENLNGMKKDKALADTHKSNPAAITVTLTDGTFDDTKGKDVTNYDVNKPNGVMIEKAEFVGGTDNNHTVVKLTLSGTPSAVNRDKVTVSVKKEAIKGTIANSADQLSATTTDDVKWDVTEDANQGQNTSLQVGGVQNNNGTASATISGGNVDTSATDVPVNITVNGSVVATGLEVTLEAATAQAFGAPKNASLTLNITGNSDVKKIVLDKAAMQKVAQATGNVVISVKPAAKSVRQIKTYTVSVKDISGGVAQSAATGNITVSAKKPDTITGQTAYIYKVARVARNVILKAEMINNAKVADENVTFTAPLKYGEDANYEIHEKALNIIDEVKLDELEAPALGATPDTAVIVDPSVVNPKYTVDAANNTTWSPKHQSFGTEEYTATITVKVADANIADTTFKRYPQISIQNIQNDYIRPIVDNGTGELKVGVSFPALQKKVAVTGDATATLTYGETLQSAQLNKDGLTVKSADDKTTFNPNEYEIQFVEGNSTPNAGNDQEFDAILTITKAGDKGNYAPANIKVKVNVAKAKIVTNKIRVNPKFVAKTTTVADLKKQVTAIGVNGEKVEGTWAWYKGDAADFNTALGEQETPFAQKTGNDRVKLLYTFTPTGESAKNYQVSEDHATNTGGVEFTVTESTIRTLSFGDAPKLTYGDSTTPPIDGAQLTDSASTTQQAVKYKVEPTNIVDIDENTGKITAIKSAGTVKITATAGEDIANKLTSAEESYTLEVAPKAVTIAVKNVTRQTDDTSELPKLDKTAYTVTPELVAGDSLKPEPQLSYEKDGQSVDAASIDKTKAGTYDIVITNKNLVKTSMSGKYTVTIHNGTLTITDSSKPQPPSPSKPQPPSTGDVTVNGLDKPVTDGKADFTATGTTVNKNSTVELKATITNSASAVKETNVKLPQATAKAFSGKGATLKVTTDLGTVELPAAATEKIGAATGDVAISVKDVSDTTHDAANKIKGAIVVSVKEGARNVLSGSGNGTIKITVSKPADITNSVYAYYDADEDNNNLPDEQLTARIIGNTVEIFIGHLSKIVLSAEPITVIPSGSGSGSGGSHGGGYVPSNNGTTKSSVYVDNSGAGKNGTVKISNKNARAGDKVTLTVKPDKGYELDKIIVKDRDGNKIEVKEERDGKFTFTMPKSGKVDITPTFTKVKEKKDDTQKNPIDMNTITSRTFDDVHANDWFKVAVDYVVSEGIMSGVGDRNFAPNDNMTRAMVWQVLAKLDGVNTAGGVKWYSKAMDWAMTHKITDGSNVNGGVTREQLASMLYRYAKDSGMDVSMKGTLTNFPDAKQASSYATEALQWAVGAGLINGMDGKLNPQGNATRAQVATILMNFNKLSK